MNSTWSLVPGTATPIQPAERLAGVQSGANGYLPDRAGVSATPAEPILNAIGQSTMGLLGPTSRGTGEGLPISIQFGPDCHPPGRSTHIEG
jgi:hypothetical protein